MSLENEIKKLTAAIEALGAKLEVQHTPTDFPANHKESETKTDNKDDKQTDIEDVIKDATEKEELTHSSVKELAIQKIASGVKKEDVKKLTSDLGADRIDALSEDNLKKFHKKLLKL